MIKSNTVSFKKALLGLSVIFLLFLSLLLVDSAEESESEYWSENQYASQSLSDLTQIINALEYNITALYPLHNDTYAFSHALKQDGSTCYFVNEEQDEARFDFMFSGPSEMCDPQHGLNHEANKRLFIAPSMAYFSNTIDTISAIYFISKDKFIISSPSDFAQNIHGDTFDSVVTNRPYWINTVRYGLTQRADQVVYTGEYSDYLTGKRVVTLTKGIYVDGDFKGVLGVDGYVSDLVDDQNTYYRIESSPSANKFGFMAYTFSHPMVLDGLNTGLYFNVDEPKRVHILHIIKNDRMQLMILLTVYLCGIIALWRYYSQQEHIRLRQLAMRDSMTGLLNRRGFEEQLFAQSEQPIVGIGVFDIDDFKKVNDQYGHAVGDEVICHVANLITSSVRSQDIVARFGGEEFVVAIMGESSELLTSIFERVQNDISLQSYRSDSGDRISVSVSGGATLYSLYRFDSLYHLWKNQSIRASDKQLYQAKVAGKNRVSIAVHAS
ncbi:sensor domain-containing diguanylate cyclase [Vibrio makurazakiensis]|uniref:sensor domain-containing diguanylate cyclase n=1 Tax=Vibrio makurazakiensis TaxID=2910250 RepID=UPI003D0F50FB